jgi:hypothetical protein
MDPSSNITRWIAFLVAPFLALAGGFIALKANSWFGMHLAPAEATAWVTTVVLGIVGLALKWLHTRGQFELAKTVGTDPKTIDQIVGAVIDRLPQAPQAPPPGTAGAPAQPQGPPA